MKMADYFQKKKGLGVLSTVDNSGRVNSAIYSKPHVAGDDHIAFVMKEKRTYANVQENPHASYLFKEEGKGYSGVRLTLTKKREERSPNVVRSMMSKKHPPEKLHKDAETLHVVYFDINEVTPLVSSGKCPVTR